MSKLTEEQKDMEGHESMQRLNELEKQGVITAEEYHIFFFIQTV